MHRVPPLTSSSLPTQWTLTRWTIVLRAYTTTTSITPPPPPPTNHSANLSTALPQDSSNGPWNRILPGRPRRRRTKRWPASTPRLSFSNCSKEHYLSTPPPILRLSTRRSQRITFPNSNINISWIGIPSLLPRLSLLPHSKQGAKPV